MKVIKRILITLLTVGMLCSLISCGGDDPAAGETDTTAGTDTQQTPTPSAPSDTDETPSAEDTEDIVLVKDGKPCFTIVCSNNSYTNIAKILADGLKEKTGIDFPNLRFDPDDGTSVIVIGSDYNEIMADGDTLLEGGYAVVEKDGDLHVCGYQENAIQRAVRNLIGQIVPKEHITLGENGKAVFAVLPKAALTFYNPKYPVADPTLLSAPLADYRIVVSAEAGAMATVQGRMIAERLAFYTGFKPSVVTDAATATEREIVIGNTERRLLASLADNAWSITGEGTKVYMNFGSSYAFDGIIDKIQHMFDDKETVNLSGTTDSYAKSTEDIRILSYNVLYSLPGDYTSQEKCASIADHIYTLRPDFIGLQEAQSFFRGVASLIAEDYGMYADAANGYLPLYYDKTVWTPATDDDGEVIQKAFDFQPANGLWGYQWVMFEGVEDGPRAGETVIFGNLHFCNTNEDPDYFYRQWRPEQIEQFNTEIKRLEEEYAGTPMFFTGDYNTGIYQTGNAQFADGWEEIVGGTQLVSGMMATDDHGGVQGGIDHVCIDPNVVEVIRFRCMSYRLIYTVSDHLPVFIDVRPK